MIERGPVRVNSDKRHGPQTSDCTYNEIQRKDILSQENADSDVKAESERLKPDTSDFKIHTSDTGPTLAGPLES